MNANVSRQSLEQALSPERLRPYLADADGDFELAWALYRWNLRLVGSLMPLISDVEVTLRNTIHRQLTDHFGTPEWWSSPKLLLDDDTREMIGGVVRKHRKKLESGSEGSGRVVADLTLGVWVNLLSKGKPTARQQPVNYDENLWRRTLMYGFRVGNEMNARGSPKRPIRRHVHQAAANLQALRNAAVHHRKIIDGIRQPGKPPEHPRIPLAKTMESSIELLGWMNPELANLHRGPTALAQELVNRPRQ